VLEGEYIMSLEDREVACPAGSFDWLARPAVAAASSKRPAARCAYARRADDDGEPNASFPGVAPGRCRYRVEVSFCIAAASLEVSPMTGSPAARSPVGVEPQRASGAYSR
jgi:hypothetical protein